LVGKTQDNAEKAENRETNGDNHGEEIKSSEPNEALKDLTDANVITKDAVKTDES